MATPERDDITGTATTGHEWDGIKELNTPLPRWWLWTFYATIVWALIYTAAYPAWPLIAGATKGFLGYSSRAEVAGDMARARVAQDQWLSKIRSASLEQIVRDPELLEFARAGGAAAFKVNCIQCHGSGASGAKGFPNLNDDDWLWGGDLDAIHTTLLHGIRQPGDDKTLTSLMPAFDGALDAGQVGALADHVLSFTGKAKSSPLGAQLYADNCAVCHGAAGEGSRIAGAPRLSDPICLYGGSKEEIERQILEPRMGVMPSWAGRLDPVTIKMLAAYVHSLGGGEQTPAMAAATKAGDAGAQQRAARPAAPVRASDARK